MGHVLFTRAYIEEPLPGSIRGSTPAVLLAPLAVHPDFQDTGVGSRLVAEDSIPHACGREDRSRPRPSRVLSALRFRAGAAVRDQGATRCSGRGVDGHGAAEFSLLEGVIGTAALGAPFDDPKYW